MYGRTIFHSGILTLPVLSEASFHSPSGLLENTTPFIICHRGDWAHCKSLELFDLNMPRLSFFERNAAAPLFRHFPRYAGVAVASFGVLIIISWHAHWQSILQAIPNTAPMQYNTAVCFILLGTALFLLTTAHAATAPWPGGTAVFFTLLTLLEYLTGWDFRIDHLFFKPYLQVATMYPGRMSPLAAACFSFIGTGIILVGANKQWRHRLTLAGMLA